MIGSTGLSECDIGRAPGKTGSIQRRAGPDRQQYPNDRLITPLVKQHLAYIDAH